jgi:RNA recognition motif-containing protein
LCYSFILNMPRAELFVGNLSRDTTRRDIEEVFDKYGRLLGCELKNKGMGSSFCFVEFEDEREAEVIIRIFCCYCLKCFSFFSLF